MTRVNKKKSPSNKHKVLRRQRERKCERIFQGEPGCA